SNGSIMSIAIQLKGGTLEGFKGGGGVDASVLRCVSCGTTIDGRVVETPRYPPASTSAAQSRPMSPTGNARGTFRVVENEAVGAGDQGATIADMVRDGVRRAQSKLIDLSMRNSMLNFKHF